MDTEISALLALFPENGSRQKNRISFSPSFPPTLTPCCKWLSQLFGPHTSATRECQRCSCCTAALLPVSQWWLTKPYRAYRFTDLTSSSPAIPKFREIFLSTVKKLLQLIPVSNGKQGLYSLLFLPSGNMSSQSWSICHLYNSIKGFHSKHFSPTLNPNPQWPLNPPAQP